ncbi:MAG: 16S rRNA (guanine(966)-N(2))-methyltransferase RsmD [Betaproteobacteria bacterium]|nr:16S rRNA (guanine(966)-N(2))-methyltransferase RsmD [Betaproteobacteria bacterium]
MRRNHVRIIGGELKRRHIEFPDALGLRPTPDRVRETLFNWLGQDLAGLRCLDLFAGSGVLGFEALSRGAGRVVMVDSNPRVVGALRANVGRLGVTQVEVRPEDAVQFLAREAGPFDVVFVDPPYGQGWVGRIVPLLPRQLSADAWVYVESEAPLVPMGGWEVRRQGRAGQVHFHLLKRAPC